MLFFGAKGIKPLALGLWRRDYAVFDSSISQERWMS